MDRSDEFDPSLRDGGSQRTSRKGRAGDLRSGRGRSVPKYIPESIARSSHAVTTSPRVGRAHAATEASAAASGIAVTTEADAFTSDRRADAAIQLSRSAAADIEPDSSVRWPSDPPAHESLDSGTEQRALHSYPYGSPVPDRIVGTLDGPHCLPARLPRLLHARRHGRKRARRQDRRRRRQPVTRKLHLRARSAASASACTARIGCSIRRSARAPRAQGRSSASPGTKRSIRSRSG